MAAAVTSYADVMQALLPVSSVVAIRYHNVLCALQLVQAHHSDQLLPEA